MLERLDIKQYFRDKHLIKIETSEEIEAVSVSGSEQKRDLYL